MRARRALRLAAAASLVSLVTLGAWACFGLIDPAGGFLVQLEVTAPDTIRLGEDGTAVVQAVDERGRRIEAPKIQWTLDPVAMFGAPPPAPTSEFHFHPQLPGVGFLTADLAGGPLRSRDGPVQAVVWSLAQGVRVGSERGDRVVYLGLDDTLTLQARVLTVDGTPVPGGEAFEWKFLQRSGAVDTPKGLSHADNLLIRGYGRGEDTIEVSHRFCQGSCAATIIIRVAMVPNTITIEPIPQLTYIGQQVGLGATVTDTAGRPVAAPVQWALANPADSVVVGLQDNMVEARGNGSVLVNATFNGLTASATIDVWQQVASLTLNPASPPDLAEGQRDTVRVHADDPGGHPLLRSFSLSAYADNPAVVAVAVVDGGIERTAQASGTTLVSVYVEGLSVAFPVIVNPVLDSLDVRIGRDTLHFLGSSTLAEAWGLHGSSWSLVNVGFTSSDSAVATVQSGRVFAQKGGSTWIRATAGGQTDSARLVVDQVVASLGSSPAAAMVVNGGSVSLRASAVDSGGQAIPDVPVLWGTSNAAVAQVDSDGVVAAVGVGSAQVSVTSDGLSARARVTVVPPLAAAAVGGSHLCAIASDGALYCMGHNGWGELGDGTYDDHIAVPVRAAPAWHFTQVATGSEFTCAIATDARTYCWGENAAGQLGNGSMGTGGSPIPTPVQADPGFVSLSAAGLHVCGLTAAGIAYCWGSNQLGEAGVGHTSPVTTPTPVTGGLTFRSIGTGLSDATCGVAADSVAYCWGGGASAPSALSTPVRFLAFTSMCGIATDGTLYCRSGADVTPVPGGGTYRALSGGGGFHCAVSTDDHVDCFGSNYLGQLGTGDFVSRAEPTRTLLSGQGDLVAAGDYAACARKVGGGLSCWGASYYSIYTPTPIPVIYP